VSGATLQAIEDAIAAHLADEYDEPWLVTHWYAIACASDTDMERTNYVHMAPIAPLHTSLGLIRIADNRLVALIESDDDE
jgi:hypothetical protein